MGRRGYSTSWIQTTAMLATGMVASAGNTYFGLWYPIVVAIMTAVIGVLFLRDTKDVGIASN
ncbi:MAG: hypothetical protein HY245_03405 [Rhizobiales bacterium]|nr:hypothetical protein [Hyphomicrobiales bacterium]MBI3672472.1 hypothetical protein [Hyphomicrobiales bacterium]